MARRSTARILLFVAVVAGFIWWRQGGVLVWDDTNVFKTAVRSWIAEGRDQWLQTFVSYIQPAFGAVGNGYRPIASLLQSWSILTIKSVYPDWPHLLFVGACIGALAVAFDSLASRFIRTRWLRAACLVLFLFASPLVQASWIMYSGIPALVPLFTCIGAVLYFSARETTSRRRRLALLGSLTAIVLISSWYREFMIALPIAIIAMEIVQSRRLTGIAVLAAVLVVPCLFPTAIPWAWFTITGRDTTLPLFMPVFRLGSVGAQLSESVLRQQVSRHVLSIPSPSLLLIGFAAFAMTATAVWRRGAIRANEGGTAALAACTIGVTSLAAMPFTDAWLPYHAALMALLLVAWSLDGALAVWTAVFIAPFYFVYTERVHLAYPLIPLTIVIVAALERTWAAAREASSRTAGVVVRTAVAVAVAIGTADALANAVSVRRVMIGVSDGIRVVAGRIGELPANRPVAIIGNGLHVDDLRLYLDEGYQLLWTIPTGHSRPEDVTERPAQLAKFLAAKLPTTDVYFLAMRHDYLPTKQDFHHHRFVAGCSTDMEAMGRLHTTRVEYLMPDPLRWPVHREYYAFLGPPDLVDDFYFGPSERPMFGAVRVDYELFRVRDAAVKPWVPEGPVRLINGNRDGFSIVEQNRRYFGIPIGEGAFSYERVCRNDYTRTVEFDTFAALEARFGKLR